MLDKWILFIMEIIHKLRAESAAPVALQKFPAEATVIFFPPKREKFQIQLISPGDTKGSSVVNPQPFPGKRQAVKWL